MYTLLYAFKLNYQFNVVTHLDVVMDLAEEIANRLKRSNVLLEAPMGWGKTYTLMKFAVLLAKEGWRVGVVAPTLTLLAKKWPQLLEMLQRELNPPRAMLSAGAGQYCVYKWENPQRHCHRCRLRRSFAINTPVVTYEEIEKMVPEDVCGYWAQETSLNNYDIVLGHYGRLPKMKHINVLLVDEAHEFYLPHIVTYDLYEIATLLGVDVEELNLDTIKELVEERLLYVNDPLIEDKLWSLRNALRKTCWIENETLNCLDIYDLPRGIRMFATTATPPPNWPPKDWGERIVIRPKIKPKAYVETDAKFYYKDGYYGASLMLHLVVNWLRREFNIDEIAVFATSSLRQVLQYSLPPGVELCPVAGG
jgi:hypothetical protein